MIRRLTRKEQGVGEDHHTSEHAEEYSGYFDGRLGKFTDGKAKQCFPQKLGNEENGTESDMKKNNEKRRDNVKNDLIIVSQGRYCGVGRSQSEAERPFGQ